MIKKAISAVMAIPLAIGFCTAGHHGKEPSTTHTERPAIVYQQKSEVKENLGKFRLTFYTPYEDGWGYQTATGVRSEHLNTCAVDPSVIPYGSTVRITGNNGRVLTLKAVDCGGGIKGQMIDIFFDGTQREGYAFMAEFGEIHNVYIVR